MKIDPERLAGELRELSGSDFRSMVEKVLGGMGLSPKGVRASEGSVEMEAHSSAGDRYLVFATRELDSAKPHDIQKSVERMRRSGVSKGIFITSGGVTKEAEEYASQFDVAVADGDKLGQLFDKFGLGEELERRSTSAFLERDGARHLPSMGQLDSTMKWGYDFYKSGNYRKAIEYFEKAANLKPDYDVPYSMIGSARLALGENEKAADAFEEALRRNPSSAEGWFNLGSTLYELGKHDDELACYDKALELDKGYEKAWNNKGATLLELGKDEESLLCLERVLRNNPKNEKALANRGVALKHLGKLDEALASLDRALAVNPNNLDAWLNRGLLLHESGRHLEAIKSYDRVLEKYNTPEMQAQKASALIGAGLNRAALDALKAALAMKPGWAVAIELRARAEEALRKEPETAPSVPAEPPHTAPVPHAPLAPSVADDVKIVEPVPQEDRGPLYSSLKDFAVGDTDDAVIYTCSDCGAEVGESDKFCVECGACLAEEEDGAAEVTELPAGEPAELERIEDARAAEREELKFEEIVGMGEVLMRLGRFEDAIGRFGEARMLKEDAALAQRQGEAAHSLGLFDEALSYFEEALDADPSSVTAALGRAEALLDAGRFAAASEALDAVSARVRKSASINLAKADILTSWGRHANAIESLGEAADLHTGSVILRNRLGISLAKVGKMDDALSCFDKSVQSDPESWEAWNDRAATLACIGDLEAAIKSYDRALDIKPDAVAPLIGKASVLARQGRSEEALEIVEEAESKSKRVELFGLRAFAHLEGDDLTGALLSTDEGLRADERNPDIWNLRGLALVRLRRHAEAIEAFEEALAVAPKHSDAARNLEMVKEIAMGKSPTPKKERRLGAQHLQPSKPEKGRSEGRAARQSGVVCQRCGASNDIGAKKCVSCGARLRYKDKEDALAREMEAALSMDRPSKRQKGAKKVAKPDREAFLRELMSVPGVGYSRASELWEAGFRSEDDIHRAEMADLTRISGITPSLARKIKRGI